MNHHSKEIEFQFSSLLDSEFLSKNYGQNLEFAQYIFESFLDVTIVELNQLQSEINDNNYEQIAFISHKIKNNFLYVGASSLNKKLEQLEKAAKEKSNVVDQIHASFLIQFENLLPSIKEEYTRINQYLNS